MYLWQFHLFLNMTPGAGHTYLSAVSPFTFCNSIRLDGCTAIFRSLHRCSFRCGCVFMFVLLKDEPTSLQHGSATAVHHCRPADVCCLVSSKHCCLALTERVQPLSHQTREFFVSQAERPLGAFWQTSGKAAICLLLRSGFHLTPLASVPFPRSVPWDNSASEVWRQFLWLHAWFVLWRALSTMGPYIDRCVSLQFVSNQLNLQEFSGSTWAQFWSSRQKLWVPIYVRFSWGFLSK